MAIIILFMTTMTIVAQGGIDQPLAKINAGAEINQVGWDASGNILAVATLDGLRLYDINLQLVAQVRQGVVVNSVSWNPNGLQLAMTNGNAIEIWNWNSSTQSLTLAHTLHRSAESMAVYWSPDGARIASLEALEWDKGSSDLQPAIILIWDAKTFQLQKTIPGTYVFNRLYTLGNALDWKPNREPIIAGIGHRVRIVDNEMFHETGLIAYILDAVTGEIVKDISLLGPYALSIAWQPPSGDRITIGSELAVLWYEVSTGSFVNPLPSQSFDVQSLDWTGDGRFIASDGSVGDSVQMGAARFFASINNAGTRSLEWNPQFNRLAIATAGQNAELRIENPGLVPGFVFMPVANAGADVTITDANSEGVATISLDGSGSTDQDGAITSYQWSENNIVIAHGIHASVNLPLGTHIITLTVTDNQASFDTDEVIVVVR